MKKKAKRFLGRIGIALMLFRYWLKSKGLTFTINFIIVTLIMASPIYVGYLLYFITNWLWALSMATGYLFFWNVIPFTPFWAIDIFISMFITKIILKIRRKKC